MAWPVTRIERETDGRLNFSGMTAKSEALWGDQFLFQLWLGPSSAIIEYWGDKVVVRVDYGVERD